MGALMTDQLSISGEEREIGSGVLDLIEGSDWLQRHEAAVVAKVIERVGDYVPENILDSIRDEWGIDARAHD
jgi:hypothetical protein